MHYILGETKAKNSLQHNERNMFFSYSFFYHVRYLILSVSSSCSRARCLIISFFHGCQFLYIDGILCVLSFNSLTGLQSNMKRLEWSIYRSFTKNRLLLYLIIMIWVNMKFHCMLGQKKDIR